MNASDLVDRLLQRGGEHGRPQPGGARAIRFGPFDIVELEESTDRFMRARWKERERRPRPALLIADDPKAPGRVRVSGASYDVEAIRSVDTERLASSLASAFELDEYDAVRRVAGLVARMHGDGLTVNGLLTRHTVEHRFRGDEHRWARAVERAAAVRPGDGWRSTLAKLGYVIERLPERGHLAIHDGAPVAVVHPKASDEDMARVDRDGRPPEGLLLGDCRAQRVDFGILAQGRRLRLFDAESLSSASRWLELDTGLLGAERLPLVALLAPPSLAGGGFEALKREARDFGAQLHRRLDRKIRQEALPALAAGMEAWARENGIDPADDGEREELERAALTLVFRMVFVLFCESAGHLPMDTDLYKKVSLSGLVREAWETRDELSARSTALWGRFAVLVRAMRTGNPAWNVPAYNGALFAAQDFDGAELLEQIKLRDREFAAVLTAVGWDSEGPSGRGADFSTLEIGHIGHVYESLLSLRLSVAERPLRYDAKKDRYVSVASGSDAADPDVETGGLLWQTELGGRKAKGVYYTPVDIVRYLVEGAVLPAFEQRLREVESMIETDPEGASRHLLGFSVVDPACGSAHFLVQVVEALAERTVQFLADHPLPPLAEAMDRLRRGEVSLGAGIEDLALLRRLLVKHCVFGVDVSPMGVEVATMSLWLATFVPGLSLSYLGRNVVVGDSLIGVADSRTVVPERGLFADVVQRRLDQASEMVGRVAGGDDRTPEEVAASESADRRAKDASAGLKRLFDLWTAEQFGLSDARQVVELHGAVVIDGTDLDHNVAELVARASELSDEHRFLHWPLTFPRVFNRAAPGFDAVVGNPPWKEVVFEELSFYGRWIPGLQSLNDLDRAASVDELLREHPELDGRLEEEGARSARARSALAGGDYGTMGGDPDLYKYFCLRYPRLLRESGFLGVVLPRTAFNTKGSEGFRRWLYQDMTALRVDFLLNRRRWMFDMHPQYSVALVTARNVVPGPTHRIAVAGTATSAKAWARQSSDEGVRLYAAAFGPGLETPMLRSQDEADLLAKLRRGPRFPHGAGGIWKCFPVRELDESDDRELWLGHDDGLALWKGESFDQYDPRGDEERRCPPTDALWKKIRKVRPGSGSLVAREIPLARRRDAVLEELKRARIAYRALTNRTNARTIIACLVPPSALLANSSPYVAFSPGDPDAQALCLGIMNSLSFDWQARRFIELNVNVFLLEGLCLPPKSDDDFSSIAKAAARLSTVDDRYAEFARATGVDYGPLAPDERQSLRVEIDARVARSYGVTPRELTDVVYRDFTRKAVPPAYRNALTRRLEELG